MGVAHDPDAEHLKLLSIFHSILAAITALFSCFPLFHVVFGIRMASGAMHPSQDQGGRVFGTAPGVFSLVVPVRRSEGVLGPGPL